MSKVCQLFSGSSGNSILISSKGHNFLVDIGVSAKRCDNALLNIGIDPKNIDAVFVTHEHSDHVSGVRVFASKHKIPVLGSADCIEAMFKSGTLNDKTEAIAIDFHTEIAGNKISAFKQSHDSVDCLGYRFDLTDGRSVSICTDTGYITDNAKEIMPGSDLVFIESNHEISMVKTGPYPYYLKERILGLNGHLSNLDCGEYIKTLAESGTTRFVLSHLSRENNLPELARQTAVSALSEIGLKDERDYRLYVSPPENNSRGIVL